MGDNTINPNPTTPVVPGLPTEPVAMPPVAPTGMPGLPTEPVAPSVTPEPVVGETPPPVAPMPTV